VRVEGVLGACEAPQHLLAQAAEIPQDRGHLDRHVCDCNEVPSGPSRIDAVEAGSAIVFQTCSTFGFGTLHTSPHWTHQRTPFDSRRGSAADTSGMSG
jgi:hypothetical protein